MANHNGWQRLGRSTLPPPKSTKARSPSPRPRAAARQPGQPGFGGAGAGGGSASPPKQRDSTPAGASPPRQERGSIHAQTLGKTGPLLAQDTVLHETLEDFVSSTTLDRVVHTKGFGAFGVFQTTHSMKQYTKASIFQQPGAKTPAATRFSLAVSTKGTPDTSRNVRGFATKFFGGDGVYDLLCNHIPVFLVQDAMQFADSIRSFQPSPANNLPDPNRFWRFVAERPEATHFLLWLYSDLGTVKSLRQIRAYGVNTYVWKNQQGQRFYVKYHWIPAAGDASITRQEAVKLAGENPDIAGQDLYQTIARGGTVEYTLHVQVMNPEDAEALPFDPLDDTKVWSEEAYPLKPVGRLVLSRNPDRYLEQVEQLAFAPSNLIEGVEFSDDKMLQGRSFVYPDAQRHRLGANFRKLPANKQEGWVPADQVTSGDGRVLSGAVTRSGPEKPDYFTQAGEYYRSLAPQQQENLAGNIAADLSGASREVRQTVLRHLRSASPQLSEKVSQQMGR